MSYPSRHVIAGVLVCILVLAVAPHSFSTELYINVQDETIKRDTDSVLVSVYMETFVDSVGGIELWLFIDQDEILRFRSDSAWQCDTIFENCADSTCIEYFGDSCIVWEYSQCADTTVDCHWVTIGATVLEGSMIENWDFVSSNVLDENKRQLKIVGIANQSGGVSKAIPPNNSNTLLLKLIADVREEKLDSVECLDVGECIAWDGPDCIEWDSVNCADALIPDSICPGELSEQFGHTQILVWDNQTRLSDPHDQLIGWHWVYNCIDSVCTQWDGDVCLNWDCIEVDSTDSSYVVDTNKVKFFDSEIDLQCVECDWIVGDADNSGYIDIDDVVYIIGYIFVSGPEPVPHIGAGDANCSTEVDIDDVVYLIGYIFVGGPPPPCTCDQLL